jgi:hypothetical protein
MATIHLTHELILPDAQGREQLRRGYSSHAGRARVPRAMPGPRAQQVGHRAAALDRASSGAMPGASRATQSYAPRAWAGQPRPLRRAGRAGRGLGHAEAGVRASAPERTRHRVGREGPRAQRRGANRAGWGRGPRRGREPRRLVQGVAPWLRATPAREGGGQGGRERHGCAEAAPWPVAPS